MSDVKRFCQWCRAAHKHLMNETPNGEYVLACDYDQLKRQHDKDWIDHEQIWQDKFKALEQQLTETTQHLEAQRVATYQAVEREHAVKKERDIFRASMHERVRDYGAACDREQMLEQQLAEREAVIKDLKMESGGRLLALLDFEQQLQAQREELAQMREILESRRTT